MLQRMSPVVAHRDQSRQRNNSVASRSIADFAGPADGFTSVETDPKRSRRVFDNLIDERDKDHKKHSPDITESDLSCFAAEVSV
jgi:hypothetical protein